MKIKGVRKNLKIKKKLKNDDIKIYLGISLELSRAVWGSVSDSSLFQLILLLKVNRPLPM